MIGLIQTLNDEDLGIWREVCARVMALGLNPMAFDTATSEEITKRYIATAGFLTAKYHLGPMAVIDSVSGRCTAGSFHTPAGVG